MSFGKRGSRGEGSRGPAGGPGTDLKSSRGPRKRGKQTEKRQNNLREVRELFESVAANMLDGLIIVDWDGVILFANKAAYRIAGLRPRKNPADLTMAQILHPDDLQRALDNQMLTREDKGGSLEQYRVLSPSGKVTWIEAIGQKVSFRGQEANLITFRDVSGRMHDEEELKTSREQLLLSEKKYAEAFHSSPLAISISDPRTGTLLDINEAYEVLSGFSRDELIGRTAIALGLWTDPSDRERYIEELRSCRRIERFQARLRKKDGSTRDLVLSASVIEVGGISHLQTVVHDITDQKRMEEALKESEERYRRITSAITDYIYTVYLEQGNVVRTVHSPACEAVTGYTPEDFEKDQFLWYSMVEEEDRERVREHFNRVTTGERVHPIEHRIRRKDGSIRWVSNMPVIHRDAQGAIIFYDGVISDITERKLAEQELKESEERFKALHDASFGGIGIHDKGIILDCNLGLSDITGYSREELIGMNGFNLIAPAWRELVMQQIVIGQEKPYEAEGVRKDGTVYPLEIRGKNIPYHGRSLRVTEFRDITERRLAERGVRDRQARLDSIFRVAPTGIGVVVDRVLQDVNDRICEMTGYSREELLGQSARILYPTEEDYNFVGTEKYRQIAEKGTGSVETRWRRKDGTIMHIILSSTPIDPNDRAAGVTFTALDVTERKRAENAIRESEWRLRKSQDMAHVGHWDWYMRNNELTWSEEVCRIFGRDPEVFHPSVESFESSIHPDDLERFHAEREKGLLSPGSPGINIEHRIVRPDGSVRFIRELAEIIRDEKGSVVHVSGTAQDVTEIREAEEALRINAERMQSLLKINQMADAPVKEITKYALEEAVRLTQSTIGYLAFLNEDESILTMYSWSETAMDECRIVEKPITYMVRETGLWGEAVRQRRAIITNEYNASSPWVKGYPEGHVVINRHMNVPVFDGGHIVLVAGIGNKREPYDDTDVQQLTLLMEGMWRILDRKRSEAALKESEERYRLMAELTGKLIYDYDVASGSMSWHGAVSQLTGFLPEEFGGVDMKAWNAMIHPEDRSGAVMTLEAALQDCSPYQAEYQLRRKDGSYIYVEDHGVFLPDENGNAYRMLGSIGDITERKQAEEALRQKTEQLDEFFNVAVDLLAVADIDGRFHLLNPSWERALGFTRKELMRGRFFDFIHPDDIKATEDAVSRLTSGEEIINFVNRYRCKDGTYRWIEWRSAPAGTMIYAAARDITERIRATEALKESEERYHSLFDNSHAVMLLIEPETGMIVDANPAACAYYGYTREEFTSRKITEINTLTPDEVFAEMERAKALKIRSFIFRHRLADGTIRDVEVFSGPIVVAGRTLLYSIVHDITERRKAEEALKESEERFRSLIQNSADIIVILDGNGAISYETPSLSHVLGYTEGSLLGRSPLDFMHPDDAERVAHDLGEVYQNTNEGLPTEFRFRKADGAWIHLEAIGSNLMNHPGINGVVITARDITDRKKAEELRLEMERRLLHAQRLESLGVMAGGIAHDFNNLLMAILGNLDLAQLDLSPVSRSRPFIDHAMVAARRAADLTNQMLAYSGKGRFDLKTFDLSELVDEMSHLLKASISKTVTLNLQTARGLPSIKADPGQIQQIIMNLIVNASEAIGDSPGVVTITTGSMKCTEDDLKQSRLKEKPQPGEYVFTEVSDTGCGMDEETMDRLFDPFFTTKFTGRGLGLAAVSGIITGHRGAIMVESEPGRGTTIRVLLPVSYEQPRGAERGKAGTGRKETGEKKERLPGGTVLVVDDEEMVRDLCRSMVERLGFTVVTASDGEEALRIFQDNAPGIICVILDLTMPRKDGMETFDELRGLDKQVRVILSSGFDEQEVTQRFLGKGLAGFIKKPYRLEVLRKELERVLGNG